MAEFLVVGVNHRSGTTALREALYVEEERQAELLGMRAPYSWTLWEYLWEVAEPGAYALLA